MISIKLNAIILKKIKNLKMNPLNKENQIVVWKEQNNFQLNTLVSYKPEQIIVTEVGKKLLSIMYPEVTSIPYPLRDTTKRYKWRMPPEELVTTLSSFLSVKDVACLSGTCKNLHALRRVLLFDHLSLILRTILHMKNSMSDIPALMRLGILHENYDLEFIKNELHIKPASELDETLIIKILKKYNNYVENLELKNKKNIASIVETIAENCPKLRYLNLALCTKLTDSQIKTIAQNCPELQEINLAHCNLLTDKSIEEITQYCPHIESINLSRCHTITDTAVIKLAESYPHLQTLILAGCKNITRLGIKEIALHCKKLRNIDLADCFRIDDKAIKFIAKNCSNLRTISLYSNRIVDKTIIILSRYCKDLTSIKLKRCQDITTNACINLANNCPKLRLIDVSNCNLNSKSDIQFLERNYPMITIIK